MDFFNEASPDAAPNAAPNVQWALAQRIAEGADTAGLLAALGPALCEAAVLEDPGLSQREVWPAENGGEAARLLPYLSARTSPAFGGLRDFTRQQGAPLSLRDDFPELTVYRLITPVTAGGERLGVLSLLRTDGPFDSAAETVLSHAAALFAVHLAQQKRLEELELRLKGNFVDDLVSLRYSGPESILSRARALDFNLLLPHRVLVGEIENLSQLLSHLKNGPKEADRFRAELIGKIQGCLDGAAAGGGMATYVGDEIVMLVRQESPSSSIAPAKAVAEDIIAAVGPVKLYIGIGNTALELADYKQSYMEAKKALEIGTYMITEGQVRSFEQFKVHALFLSTLKPAELYGYARSQLGALLEYDARHRTELLKTLQEFLYLRNNVEGTAKSLTMSVSGLKYRLSKIERILGCDLKDYKICFDLQLALIILQLLGEYRINNPL